MDLFVEIRVPLLVTAVADVAETVDALQVGIVHPHALHLIVEEDVQSAAEKHVRVVRMYALVAAVVHALELVRLHVPETVMEAAVIHVMVVQIIAKEIVVTPVLEDAKIHVPGHVQ